eukprot:431486_1
MEKSNEEMSILLESTPLISTSIQNETDNPPVDVSWSQLIGGSIGNILEWYDWSTFGLLASELGDNFFPSDSNNAAIELLEAYGVFAAAFIMRPIGGVIFGVIGDKTGRKRTLQISILLMFITTFTMGCLPTYSVIGIWAPILLTILRLFQGISVGGQLVGSILFILESTQKHKRGFYGAFTMMTASWVISLLYLIFTKNQMTKWCWRIPFLSSIIVGILGFISQIYMEQSHEFVNAIKKRQISDLNPIQKSLKYYWKIIILIAVTIIPWSAGGYITFTFLPIYLQSQLQMHNALLISSFLLIWKMFMLLIGGYIADKICDYLFVMRIGVMILCIWSFPAYYVMQQIYVVYGEYYVFWPLIISDLITGIALGLFGGPMQIFMVNNIDDVCVRYTVIGIGYNICQAVFGGTAPLIGSALSLINFYYVGLYITVFSAISTVILYLMERKKYL